MATIRITLNTKEYESLIRFGGNDHVLLDRPRHEAYNQGDILWIKDQVFDRCCWRQVRKVHPQPHCLSLSLDIYFGETRRLEIPQDYAGKVPGKSPDV